MAVRKCVFEAGHRFNESVGPSSGNYIMGSETEFTIRVHEAGHRSWFCDTARVKHIIREDQLSQDWVIRRAYRFGRNQWVQESQADFTVPLILGIPRWRFAALASEYLRYTLSYLRRDNEKLFRARWEIQFLQGYLSEAINSRKHRCLK